MVRRKASRTADPLKERGLRSLPWVFSSASHINLSSYFLYPSDVYILKPIYPR